jgi:hypothetical protein
MLTALLVVQASDALEASSISYCSLLFEER